MRETWQLYSQVQLVVKPVAFQIVLHAKQILQIEFIITKNQLVKTVIIQGGQYILKITLLFIENSEIFIKKLKLRSRTRKMKPSKIILKYRYCLIQILQKMHLNVKIQDKDFKLNIGSGFNDWAWLSHYAARKFSKISYPQGTYLPTQVLLVDKQNQKFYPHPREKISNYLQQNKLSANNITTLIKIRKGNHVFSQYQKIWQNEAYGLERMMMSVIYILETQKYKNKEGDKQYIFKVYLHYTMHNDLKHMFNEKKYASPIQLELQQKRFGKYSTYKCHIKLPYGDISNQLSLFRRDPKDPSNYRQEKIKAKGIPLNFQFFKESLLISPKYISISEQNEKVAHQMKITENITKSLQQKQLEAKKRNANSSLCCYGFEQFWKLLEENHGDELLFENYDKSTREKLKVILQKSLNDIYEIFFYYFIVENQTKQKKEELGITYQHIMHFLRFYDIFPDLEGLHAFLQYYNCDFKFKNIKDTVDIEGKSVKFVQFVSIMLRAIQFIQTSTFMVKGETFDVSVAKIIDHIIELDTEEEQFGEFKRNIRENPSIISFFRNYSEPLKKIFVNQITRSTQKASDKYVLMKEQFKSLLQLSGLTNKNTDSIVQDLFDQLNLSEEGIFYYEFIEAIQWLALALVTSDKDGNNIQNEEQEALLIIQKIKFFMEKVQL